MGKVCCASAQKENPMLEIKKRKLKKARANKDKTVSVATKMSDVSRYGTHNPRNSDGED